MEWQLGLKLGTLSPKTLAGRPKDGLGLSACSGCGVRTCIGCSRITQGLVPPYKVYMSYNLYSLKLAKYRGFLRGVLWVL